MELMQPLNCNSQVQRKRPSTHRPRCGLREPSFLYCIRQHISDTPPNRRTSRLYRRKEHCVALNLVSILLIMTGFKSFVPTVRAFRQAFPTIISQPQRCTCVPQSHGATFVSRCNTLIQRYLSETVPNDPQSSSSRLDNNNRRCWCVPILDQSFGQLSDPHETGT